MLVHARENAENASPEMKIPHLIVRKSSAAPMVSPQQGRFLKQCIVGGATAQDVHLLKCKHGVSTTVNARNDAC